MVQILDLYRWIFMDVPVSLYDVVHALVLAVVVLAVGFKFFIGAEHRYGRP
jgi:ABC-type polysaccharide/polyol phosphate export permease